jgi:hypothetical protein
VIGPRAFPFLHFAKAADISRYSRNDHILALNLVLMGYLKTANSLYVIEVTNKAHVYPFDCVVRLSLALICFTSCRTGRETGVIASECE